VPCSRQLFVPRECSREPWRECARNKGVPSQLSLVVLLPSKHHLCPGGQGGSSTPTQGGKMCHLPSLVAPRVTQKGWFPRPLKRGVSVTGDAELCPQIAGLGLCSVRPQLSLGLSWHRQAMPHLPRSVVLRPDSTCGYPPCRQQTVTSNNSTAVLRLFSPFGKPRAGDNCTAT